jgi:hypothetical protein
MGDRRLQGIEAVVERKQSVAPERDHGCLLCLGQGSGVRGFRPGLQILNRRSLTPLRHRLGVDPRSRLSAESEACDRCIAALTACVVVALP